MLRTTTRVKMLSRLSNVVRGASPSLSALRLAPLRLSTSHRAPSFPVRSQYVHKDFTAVEVFRWVNAREHLQMEEWRNGGWDRGIEGSREGTLKKIGKGIGAGSEAERGRKALTTCLAANELCHL